MPELLTVSEAATLLRKTPNAVYLMIERGQLPAACVARVGKRVLLRNAALRAHLGLEVCT